VSDELAAFVAARLDEDEAAATRAAVDPVGALEAYFEVEARHQEQDWGLYPERKTEYSRGQADALLWASTAIRERMVPLSLHNPLRMLRDVAAKRKLLDTYTVIDDIGECTATSAIVGALRAMAAVWSEHADYQPEWGRSR
jgi:hypothetical protein